MLLWGMIATLMALIIALIIGSPIIEKLKRASFGQEIREEGPSWHQKKSGTPTMGGFIFLIALYIAFLFIAIISKSIDISGIIVAVTALLFGGIGLMDDYIKVIKKRNLGLTSKEKFLAQLLVSAAFSFLLFVISPNTVLFFGGWVNFSYFVIPFNMFIMLAITNAVNLTDGVDALAGTTTAISIAFFAFSAYILGFSSLFILLMAAIGGILGFLFFNRHPAKVFMGDTGSLFLGGLIGASACLMGIQFLILLTGLIFFIETLSVMLQVTYFKLTHGKRIFLMTPIHHHFEKKGWGEVKIVTVFGTITFVLSVLSAYIVYIS